MFTRFLAFVKQGSVLNKTCFFGVQTRKQFLRKKNISAKLRSIKELFFVSQKYNFVPQQMLRVLRRGNFSDNAFAKTRLRKAFVKNLSDYMFIAKAIS